MPPNLGSLPNIGRNISQAIVGYGAIPLEYEQRALEAGLRSDARRQEALSRMFAQTMAFRQMQEAQKHREWQRKFEEEGRKAAQQYRIARDAIEDAYQDRRISLAQRNLALNELESEARITAQKSAIRRAEELHDPQLRILRYKAKRLTRPRGRTRPRGGKEHPPLGTNIQGEVQILDDRLNEHANRIAKETGRNPKVVKVELARDAMDRNPGDARYRAAYENARREATHTREERSMRARVERRGMPLTRPLRGTHLSQGFQMP